jgi:hypothetical protein
VKFSGTATFNLINGNPSSPNYQTTTIRGPDLPDTSLDTHWKVTGRFSLDLDIKSNCVFGVQLGSITLDDAGKVKIAGFGLGC